MIEKPEPIDVQNLLINVRSIQSFGAMEKILKLCINIALKENNLDVHYLNFNDTKSH